MLIVYLYFDTYKSCIPITSITSEIGAWVWNTILSWNTYQYLTLCMYTISGIQCFEIAHEISMLPHLNSFQTFCRWAVCDVSRGRPPWSGCGTGIGLQSVLCPQTGWPFRYTMWHNSDEWTSYTLAVSLSLSLSLFVSHSHTHTNLSYKHSLFIAITLISQYSRSTCVCWNGIWRPWRCFWLQCHSTGPLQVSRSMILWLSINFVYYVAIQW